MLAFLVAVGTHQSSTVQHSESMAERRHQSELLTQSNDPPISQDSVLKGRIIRVAHLRAEPTTTSVSLGKLAVGDEVLILDRAGDWLHVKAGLIGGEVQYGWIYAYLTKAIP
jgi:hypothetical protein